MTPAAVQRMPRDPARFECLCEELGVARDAFYRFVIIVKGKQ